MINLNDLNIFQIFILSICGILLVSFIIWSIFVSYDSKAPRQCRFGHYYWSKEPIRRGCPQHLYCPKCGKDFGEYRIFSTMDNMTKEITDYDKNGNEIDKI